MPTSDGQRVWPTSKEPPRHQDTKGPEVPMEQDVVAHQIVASAFRVHRTLGPGLLESVYEKCLAFELVDRGFQVDRQVDLPVVYRDIRIETGFRLDMIINRQVVIEVKASERALPVHHAQMLTYLKLSGLRLGLLINFNVPRIRDGLTRLVL